MLYPFITTVTLSPHILSLTASNLFSIALIMLFQECYPNGVMQYLSFWDRLFLFSILSFRFIYVKYINNFTHLLLSNMDDIDVA